PVPGRDHRFPYPAAGREPAAFGAQWRSRRPGRTRQRLCPPDPGARRRLVARRLSRDFRARDRTMNDTATEDPQTVDEFLGAETKPRWRRWMKYWLPALILLLLV